MTWKCQPLKHRKRISLSRLHSFIVILLVPVSVFGEKVDGGYVRLLKDRKNWWTVNKGLAQDELVRLINENTFGNQRPLGGIRGCTSGVMDWLGWFFSHIQRIAKA